MALGVLILKHFRVYEVFGKKFDASVVFGSLQCVKQ